jgi:hypothetical protein
MTQPFIHEPPPLGLAYTDTPSVHHLMGEACLSLGKCRTEDCTPRSQGVRTSSLTLPYSPPLFEYPRRSDALKPADLSLQMSSETNLVSRLYVSCLGSQTLFEFTYIEIAITDPLAARFLPFLRRFGCWYSPLLQRR